MRGQSTDTVNQQSDTDRIKKQLRYRQRQKRKRQKQQSQERCVWRIACKNMAVSQISNGLIEFIRKIHCRIEISIHQQFSAEVIVCKVMCREIDGPNAVKNTKQQQRQQSVILFELHFHIFAISKM